MILKGYLFSFLYVLACIAIAIVAYKLGSPKKYTRKIVHILVGFEWVILYHFLGDSWHTVAICAIFTLLLLLSFLKKLLPMMSSDGDNDPGTVYYGVSMTVMAIICLFVPEFMYPFGIAVFCTSIGDGFAGMIGAAAGGNVKLFKNKTLIGTVAGFFFSLAAIAGFSWVFSLKISLVSAAAIALFVAGVELISIRGLDNITIPIGTSVLTFILLYYPQYAIPYVLPIVLTPFVVAIALEKNILTPRGVLIAVAMDIIVSVAFGNFGFALLACFLFLSVAVDKLVKRFRRDTDDVTKKTGKRDEFQVLANGVIPLVMAVLYIITREAVFIVAYSAALSEAFSDTSASGFGAFSSRTYDVFRLKSVPKGLSGGVSIIGTVSALLAALAFPLISVAFGAISFKVMLLVGLCAFAGCVFDSMLGSLVQVKYKCSVCGKITEKSEHCNAATEYYKGVRFVTNDFVNLASTLFASLLSILLYILIF